MEDKSVKSIASVNISVESPMALIMLYFQDMLNAALDYENLTHGESPPAKRQSVESGIAV